MILGTLAVALVAGVVLTWTATPVYVSSARLFIAAQVTSDDVDELYQRNAIAQARVASYVSVASGSSVARQVSEAVDFEVDYEQDVQATVLPETVVLQITVTDSDRARARDVAAAYAEILPQAIQDLEQVGGSSAARVQAKVIDEADLPESPVSPSVVRNLVLASLLGVGAGVGLAVLRHVIAREMTVEEPGPGAA